MLNIGFGPNCQNGLFAGASSGASYVAMWQNMRDTVHVVFAVADGVHEVRKGPFNNYRQYIKKNLHRPRITAS